MKRFFEWNRRLSERVGSGFPHVKAHNSLNWAKDVAEYLDAHPGAKVLDVGAGRRCLFVEYMRDPKSVSIVGVDISLDEMLRNPDLSERHEADVCKALPFPEHSFDAVVSHSVLEHLDSQEKFFAEAARVLKPGGAFIHWLPNKYAPFAILNRLIPNRLSRKLLHATWDDTKGISGFPAKYDRCSPSQMRRLLKSRGFVDPLIQFSYYSSAYYAFFLPSYLLSLIYEVIVSTVRIQTLSSYLLIRAAKGNR